MNENPTVKTDNIEARHDIKITTGNLENICVNSIFELIRDIKDPEHYFTLEQLNVICKDNISIYEITDQACCLNVGLPISCVEVQFTPTIPHCSMAAIIGLTIKYILKQFIKKHVIYVRLTEGSHVNDKQINKQLNDKDRVLAAYQNDSLISVINECIPSSLCNYL